MPRLFLLTEEQPESQRDILEDEEDETVIVNTLTEEFDSDDEYDSDGDIAIDKIIPCLNHTSVSKKKNKARVLSCLNLTSDIAIWVVREYIIYFDGIKWYYSAIYDCARVLSCLGI